MTKKKQKRKTFSNISMNDMKEGQMNGKCTIFKVVNSRPHLLTIAVIIKKISFHQALIQLR